MFFILFSNNSPLQYDAVLETVELIPENEPNLLQLGLGVEDGVGVDEDAGVKISISPYLIYHPLYINEVQTKKVILFNKHKIGKLKFLMKY